MAQRATEECAVNEIRIAVDSDEDNLTVSSSEFDEYEKCDCIVQDSEAKLAAFPYISLYDIIHDNSRRQYFLPGVALKATITSAHRDTEHSLHLFNPYIYCIDLEHGPHKWSIEKKYTDFQKLHNHLLMYRAVSKLAGPMRRRKQLKPEEPRTMTTLCYTNNCELYDCPLDIDEKFDPNSTRNFFGDANFSVRDDSLPVDNKNVEGDDRTTKAAQGRDQTDGSAKRKFTTHKMPHFPLLPDSLVLAGHVDHRRDELQRYLCRILHIPSLKNHHETAEFLEVSRLSFVYNLGGKFKEGIVKKRPGGRLDYRSLRRYCCENCGKWNKRWLMVKDSFIAYMDPHNWSIHEVLLFDPDFQVLCGGQKVEGVPKSLSLSNLSRELILKCDSERAASRWHDDIKKVLSGPGKQWTKTNRFGSSYPVRDASYAQWFVDGRRFMEYAANMMELAKEEIFITDWWLTPEVYMKRPAQKTGDPWQLINILKRKAEQGVRVFVLIYKELEIALGIGSAYAKRILMNLHPRILVMRHPEHIPYPWMWAHHEKIIVIDQNIAFVGGIDLCYGRWDDHGHKLVDVDNPSLPTVESPEQSHHPKTVVDEIKVFTGKQKLSTLLAAAPVLSNDVDETDDNAATSDAATRRVAMQTSASPSSGTGRWRNAARRAVANGRKTFLRAPTQTPINAPTPRFNLADIVVQYQSYLESDKMQTVKAKENTPPMGRKSKISTVDRMKHLLKRESLKDDIYNEYEDMLLEIERHQEQYEKDAKGSYWIGKDYVNFIFKDVVGLELPYCDLVDRKIVPRMPWHDISSVVYGDAARDVARHFIQRWNACKQEKLKKIEMYPLLMPKSYENVHVPPIFRNLSHSCSAQILRSARSWSCAINTVEESIHQAYIKLIANAKHYIYIENQFFISLIDGREVRNQIAQALLGRIVKAHKSRETFRVYILMPLLPAFEGVLGEPSGASLQTILHWTYSSISKGPNSLLYNLEKEVGDFSKYIRFYALRTHTDLCGRLMSELIYIHSKLIIVDDIFALIGSANINDRSLLGERDSEVVLFVEDKEFVQSKMDGNDYRAGKFCSSLRRQLLAEHLGFLDDKISSADKIEKEQIRDLLQDPVCDKFYQYFTNAAKKNTEIYDEIFKCFPSDQVRTWSDLAAYKRDASTNCPAVSNRLLAEHKIEQLSGTLVEFPTKFLLDENLAPQMLSKEGLAPVTLFT